MDIVAFDEFRLIINQDILTAFAFIYSRTSPVHCEGAYLCLKWFKHYYYYYYTYKYNNTYNCKIQQGKKREKEEAAGEMREK